MGQSPSRTADFAEVLPTQQGTKSSQATVSSGTSSPVVVGSFRKLPEHSIAPINSSVTRLNPSVGDALSLHCESGQSDDTSGLYAEPESVRKSRVLDEHADVCSEILEGFLYISNLRVAQDHKLLDAYGITHIVDCCSELTVGSTIMDEPNSKGSGRTCLHLALRDDTREDLTPFLRYQAIPFIIKCRQQHVESGKAAAKVLIHCHQGVSRSCAVAIAFVMLDRSMSFREATAFVKQQRPISSPNAAFLCQLIQWGRDLEAIIAQPSTLRYVNGLLRLAPHASHDSRTLVLKQCGSSTDVWKEEDAPKLWSGGAYVYEQADGLVAIWVGACCEIKDAARIARELLSNAMVVNNFAITRAARNSGLQTNNIPVSEIRGPSGLDKGKLLEYPEEMHWYQSSTGSSTFVDNHGSHQSDEFVMKDSSPTSLGIESPQLYVLEALDTDGSGKWDRLKQYDADDLTSEDAFLLMGYRSDLEEPTWEGFLWIGGQCSHSTDKALDAAKSKMTTSVTLSGKERSGPDNISVERQNFESEFFWQMFELGY